MARENIATNNHRNTRPYWVFPLCLMCKRALLCTGVQDQYRETITITEIEKRAYRKSRRLSLGSQKLGRLAAVIILLTFQSVASAQEITVGDGIPDRAQGVERPVVMHFWDDASFSIKEEVFNPPIIKRDFGKVVNLFQSPVEASRLVDNIPTASLAKWHWWLLKEDVLNRAIRQYAKCVARVSLMQELMGEVALDNPKHKDFFLIKSGEEYLPAFEVVQPFDYERGLDYVIVAGKRHYQEHIRAVIETINLTVNTTSLCESTEAAYKAYFFSKWRFRK